MPAFRWTVNWKNLTVACRIFKFLRCSLDVQYLMRFQSEQSETFSNSFRCSDRALPMLTHAYNCLSPNEQLDDLGVLISPRQWTNHHSLWPRFLWKKITNYVADPTPLYSSPEPRAYLKRISWYLESRDYRYSQLSSVQTGNVWRSHCCLVAWLGVVLSGQTVSSMFCEQDFLLIKVCCRSNFI